MLGYITLKQLKACGASYATVIPPSIREAIRNATGQSTIGHIVIVYHEGHDMGGLMPVTRIGALILERWDGKVSDWEGSPKQK